MSLDECLSVSLSQFQSQLIEVSLRVWWHPSTISLL